jgi:hypothetical protein
MDPAIEARVLELRRQHPSWGAATLRHRPGREGVAEPPSLGALTTQFRPTERGGRGHRQWG